MGYEKKEGTKGERIIRMKHFIYSAKGMEWSNGITPTNVSAKG
jgi:hypothetical protein